MKQRLSIYAPSIYLSIYIYPYFYQRIKSSSFPKYTSFGSSSPLFPSPQILYQKTHHSSFFSYLSYSAIPPNHCLVEFLGRQVKPKFQTPAIVTKSNKTRKQCSLQITAVCILHIAANEFHCTL